MFYTFYLKCIWIWWIFNKEQGKK